MKKSTLKKVGLGLLILILGFSIYFFIKVNLNQGTRETECFERLLTRLNSGENPDDIFTKDLEKLQILVEKSLVARSEMLVVSQDLMANEDKPVSSQHLLILKQGTEDYLSLRGELYKIALAYECALDVETATLNEFNIKRILSKN